jgi:hypothetical protein
MKSKKLVAVVLVDHPVRPFRGTSSRHVLSSRHLQISITLSFLLLLLPGACQAQFNSVDASPDVSFGTPLLTPFNLNGRIPGMVLDPNNNSIVYAAGEWTGVWKSVDGAHTWAQNSHGLRNGITQEFAYPNLAIDATNSQRLLYATTSKDGRGFSCPGCQFGGLWISVDGAASWQHANLCSVNSQADNITSVVFSSGRPFVATGCGVWTTIDPSLQTGWSTLTLPPGVSLSGAIFAPSSYSQTLFACLGGGTRVYRSLNLGQTWDAGVDVGGNCRGLAVAPLPGEFQPSTSVVVRTTPAPVAKSGPGSNALEVTEVNHNLATTQNLGFASVATGGSGRPGVWTVRRTAPANTRGPGFSYDVFAADGLKFYRYTGINGLGFNTLWIGPFQLHVDTWWMEFPSAYDGTGNCTAYAANDGGVLANASSSCAFNGWVAASSGLHVAWGNTISGLPSANVGNNATLCATGQGGQPCPLLFLATTDDDVFIRSPCMVQSILGCNYSWGSFGNSLGDAAAVLIDPAQPNLALGIRSLGYNMFAAPSGQLPTVGMIPFSIIPSPNAANLVQGIQAPRPEAIKQVLTMPNESPLKNGDFLGLESAFSNNICLPNQRCPNDIIVRNLSAGLQNVAANSWTDISPQKQFGPGYVSGIYPSGGHNNLTVYVLTSSHTAGGNGVKYVPPFAPGQVYKAQIPAIGESITTWQLVAGSGVNIPPGNGASGLSQAYNLFVNPYDPTELWAIDLGSTPTAIKVSRDGGQSWAAVQQLKDIATNHSEFDFTCGTFPFANGPSNYNDKDIFGNECSMTQMVFPAGQPQMRFAVLYPGGIAFSSDAGNSWIPLNATNAQASLQPIEMPQSAFYDPTVNSAGDSSLYVALEGKGVKRIDAPFATMTSVPGCTSALSCSGITFGFPSLVVSCPSAVNFYQFANTPNQKLVCTSCQSYTAPTLNVANAVAACAGQTSTLTGFSGGSCSYFSTFEASPTYCGAEPPQPPDYCQNCVKTGGKCSTLADGKKVCVHQ